MFLALRRIASTLSLATLIFSPVFAQQLSPDTIQIDREIFFGDCTQSYKQTSALTPRGFSELCRCAATLFYTDMPEGLVRVYLKGDLKNPLLLDRVFKIRAQCTGYVERQQSSLPLGTYLVQPMGGSDPSLATMQQQQPVPKENAIVTILQALAQGLSAGQQDSTPSGQIDSGIGSSPSPAAPLSNSLGQQNPGTVRCSTDALARTRCDNGVEFSTDQRGLTRFGDGTSATSNSGGLTKFGNGLVCDTNKGGLTRCNDGTICETDKAGMTHCHK